ncbi:sodium-translocating pyrophosphatase [bacterium]|jgi:K(+)-stimulated pyrophosphate-energized sodium pump|nr:sodium-translocating pyrophosphatase [bacterium]MBT3581931.1 sodium-translocating pyrophosphatase [bacterium]MBT4551716.1 sodium-translocating pyrophosphatase [bacterium]MBT7088688.1 sodium-translocating pyrophosphatase [bacterium]
MDQTNLETLKHLFWIAPVGASLALAFAYYFFKDVMKNDEGTPRMKEIAEYVRKGSMTYLKQQYKIVAIYFVFAFLFFSFLAFILKVQSPWVPFAFLTGGLFSGIAGFIGMKTATNASARTTHAARTSLNNALKIALRAGAVLGLSVVGLGLLDISLWFILLKMILNLPLSEVTITMLSFGIGASSMALFARVGGGIFTKAADVGADLVGKIEANIPEDDPRNPATIADNVGDNVGDVAGMGADLYESYCGSILATAALGSAAAASIAQGSETTAFLMVIAPMIIAGIGTFLSIFGVFSVKTKEGASQKELLKSLERGVNVTSILIIILSAIVCYLLLNTILGTQIIGGWIGIWLTIIVGLAAGIIIGKATEYYTSDHYEPTKAISKNATTGAATVIIGGIGSGMLSTGIPVLTICTSILLAYWLSGGYEHTYLGLYGIGFAAVGMLSTLGFTLSTDAYGPIADNAGGNAEMSGLGPEVRKKTDALDSLGNTTAATGKGFCVGSAALTALALIAAYIEEVRNSLIRLGHTTIEVGNQVILTSQATLENFMEYFNVTLMNPAVLVGTFLGAMLAFVFTALTINAVGEAAFAMVVEVRRQFKEIKGILTGEGKPDYERCIAIATKGAQKQMVLPAVVALLVPIIVGLVLGVAGVIGLLVGGLVTSFSMAVFLANSGGSWDNAKKHIEQGMHGGKGSDAHKAAIVGDTVGDPFKDTAGPSLDILIKLMSMVSIVVAGLVIRYSLLG